MREQLGSIVWLCFALFGLYEGYELGVGSVSTPSTGFLPFWSAALLGVLSLVYLIVCSFPKGTKEKISELWMQVHWGRVLGVSIALALYSVIFDFFGYIMATFLLVFCVMTIMEPKRLWRHCLYSVAISVISCVIFNNFLDSRLPKGCFGF